MGYIQEIEEKLKKSIIPQTKRDDFEQFWQEQVEMLRQIPLKITRERLVLPYDKTFLTYKITFNTHDATMVEAYFSCPTNRGDEKLPCVALFHGGCGYKKVYADIVATGVCCFAIDVRSQAGTTVDQAVYTSGDRMGGVASRGILDKNEYYLKNIYLDAVRTMDVIAQLPEVDASRIVTYGASQGGGLSVVASALSGRSKKCYSIVTSFTCLKQRTEGRSESQSGIFEYVHHFLQTYPCHTEKVMETLSYFDINNMVSFLKVPTVFSIGLMDEICIPEFVYSAYYHTPCEKAVHMHPFTRHWIARDFEMFAYSEFAAM